MTTALDTVGTAYAQQGRLLADARRRRTLTASARVDAEAAVKKLELAEDAARQASSANREDAALADELHRVRLRLEHARTDLAQASAEDDAAAADVAASEANVRDAERAVERQRLRAELASGKYEADTRADTEAILGAVLTVRDRLAAIRERTAADGAITGRYHALLGDVSVRPRDGTAAAGAFAAALLAAGGRIAGSLQDGAMHPIRHIFDIPTPGSPLYDVDHAATQLMSVALAAITQGRKDADAGAPDRSRQALEDAARIWPHARDFGTARDAAHLLDGQRVQDQADANRRAHEQRLVEAHRRTEALRGVSIDANGNPIPRRAIRPQHRPLPVATDAAGIAERKRLERLRVARGLPPTEAPPIEPVDLGGEVLEGGDGAFVPPDSVEGPGVLEEPIAPRSPPRSRRRTAAAAPPAPVAPQLGGEDLGEGDGAFIPEGSVEGLTEDPDGG